MAKNRILERLDSIEKSQSRQMRDVLSAVKDINYIDGMHYPGTG